MQLDRAELITSGSLIPSARFREAKRAVKQKGFGAPGRRSQRTTVSPAWLAAYGCELPAADPQGHPSVPGLCSVFPGHSPAWDACWGREENGAGLREGSGNLFPG